MTDNIFKEEMLRKYSPAYIYNPFKELDIKDLNEVIQYAKGLVIKDSELADAYENEQSMKNSDRYIRAKEGTLSIKSEYEKNAIIKNYTEYNDYYKSLYNKYAIEPYDARKTKDYHIIKSLYNTLDKNKKKIFEESYYEALDYYLNVTYTEAFMNQRYEREFFNTYLVFSAILRYINKGIENFFDIDTYTKDMLKNGFISWGLDYFDEIPLFYQRRIYKVLNDLVRNKGTNASFEIIADLFSFDNININKYILAKKENNDGIDLSFYRVPINENLDIRNNEEVDYNSITDNDPYWRAIEEEIKESNFNTLDTKYISADIELDVVDNTKKLAYLYSLLNSFEIESRKSIESIKEKYNLNNEDSKLYGSLLDNTFYINNNDVSPEPFYLFDALSALTTLIFRRMNWSDTIHRINNVNYSYGYNIDTDNSEYISDARRYLFWSKDKFNENTWKKNMNFLNKFKLKSMNNNDSTNDILIEYNSSVVYSNQFSIISDYVNGFTNNNKLAEYLDNNMIYEAMEYLMNLLLNRYNEINMNLLFNYTKFKKLFSKFINYQINSSFISIDSIYELLYKDDKISRELRVLVYNINNTKLTEVYNSYISNSTSNNAELLINILSKTISNMINNNVYNIDINRLPNLSVYLEVFLSSSIINVKNVISIDDFVDIYNFNESLRKELEELILDNNNPELNIYLNNTWNNSFIDNFSMDNFKGNKTFLEYLLNNDPNLYYYITSDNNKTSEELNIIYRDKIFELIESIDNYMNLNTDFLLQNNFIALNDYIKRYMYILIKIFKAYTTETIYSNTLYNFDKEFDNSIKVMDSLDITYSKDLYRDFLDTKDSNSRHVYDTHYENAIEITSTIKLTIIDEGITTIKEY